MAAAQHTPASECHKGTGARARARVLGWAAMAVPLASSIPWVTHVLREGAALRTDLDADAISRSAGLIGSALREGGKLLLFGNGGSAADAQHLAAELVGRFTVERTPLPAIALTVDTSAITAIGNDFGYDHVFERQVRALGRKGDVAIAISTSGRSESVLRGVRAARALGIAVVGLTGAAGGEFAAQCDAAVVVPSRDTARIQECHITVAHIWCGLLEAELCGIPLAPHPVRPSGKRVTLAELLTIRDAYRARGRVVVWTNGCFDILHAGHVASLRAARALGDVLVVGVNEDDTVRRAKGEGRPIHRLEERVSLLAALEMVDFVVSFSDPTPAETLARLKPDIHCKGSDYAPPNGAPIPEADIVRSYGGRIEFLPLIDGLSTTRIAATLAG
jgi:phosphoheptose isomerase